MANIRGGDPPQKNKLSSGGWALVVQAFPLDECSRNPSGAVHQLALLWEAEFGLSEFFGRLFQCICPFHDGWFISTPAHTVLSVQQFLTKMVWPPCPTLPIHRSHPERLSFCFPSEKFIQGKCFADVKEGKQKTAEALKGIKIDEFKNCFEQWEKKKQHLDRCIESNGDYFEGDWSLNIFCK